MDIYQQYLNENLDPIFFSIPIHLGAVDEINFDF